MLRGMGGMADDPRVLVDREQVLVSKITSIGMYSGVISTGSGGGTRTSIASSAAGS